MSLGDPARDAALLRRTGGRRWRPNRVVLPAARFQDQLVDHRFGQSEVRDRETHSRRCDLPLLLPGKGEMPPGGTEGRPRHAPCRRPGSRRYRADVPRLYDLLESVCRDSYSKEWIPSRGLRHPEANRLPDDPPPGVVRRLQGSRGGTVTGGRARATTSIDQ